MSITRYLQFQASSYNQRYEKQMYIIIPNFPSKLKMLKSIFQSIHRVSIKSLSNLKIKTVPIFCLSRVRGRRRYSYPLAEITYPTASL